MTDRYFKLGDTVTEERFIANNSPERWSLVAVIDPTDTEAVERLWRIWTTLAPDHRLAQDNMQAALREFAAPTPPKPEEPKGLGAVVEDEAGGRWVRTEAHYPWTHTYFTDDGDECGVDCDYADLNVVRVLSEGVTA